MKTRLFLILSVALAFVACEQDSDFATLNKQDNALSSVQNNTFTVGDLPQGLAACMDVTTEHEMNGTGKLLGSYYSSFFGPRGSYEITGSGTVISDPMKDGESIIRFTYNITTRMMAGNMITHFKNGAVLDQKFEGAAQQIVNGKEMTLITNLGGGLLDTGNELMELSEGTISITLPSVPIGPIYLNVNTRGVYCTED